eukprot:CAMPEP_0185256774 /NCGR_PEP_ID=MMETSP1359-20130426/5848_1 /TAXON_ID=552665 /ORGANISM="Bigelowiella longifila, Strain CCMP242" /LENGTH=121 /DNA_ID=CAMNT_0027841511 /DNA_START=136 /DNA_END=502 /DNA_ORIENTATION=-
MRSLDQKHQKMEDDEKEEGAHPLASGGGGKRNINNQDINSDDNEPLPEHELLRQMERMSNHKDGKASEGMLSSSSSSPPSFTSCCGAAYPCTEVFTAAPSAVVELAYVDHPYSLLHTSKQE